MTLFAVSRTRADAWRSAAVLWVLFFMICCGLGYATLNRYDPRDLSLYDTRDYARLVTENPGPEEKTHRAYRVLVPLLARPIYQLANGRVGTWDPLFLALLAVNAALVAVAATVLAGMAGRLGLEHPTGLVAGLLLANHTVVNVHLAGMVDAAELCAAELCAAVLLAAALRSERWWALVAVGVGGALAKETFVAFAAVMAAVWWWMTWRRSPHAVRAALWIALMAVASLGAVLLVRLAATGEVASPVEIAQSLNRPAPGVLVRVRRLLLDADFWYGLVWLLPLGMWSIGRVPRAWVASAFATAGVALALGAYAMAGGANVLRPIISMAGAPLSLAAAITLMRQPWLRSAARASPSTE